MSDDWDTPDWAYDEVLADLDAARERIAELEAALRRAADHGIAFANSMAEARSQRDAAEARERKLVEVLRNLVGLAEIRGSLHEYHAALDDARAALSPYTPAAPEMPADCHPQGE